MLDRISLNVDPKTLWTTKFFMKIRLLKDFENELFIASSAGESFDIHQSLVFIDETLNSFAYIDLEIDIARSKHKVDPSLEKVEVKLSVLDLIQVIEALSMKTTLNEEKLNKLSPQDKSLAIQAANNQKDSIDAWANAMREVGIYEEFLQHQKSMYETVEALVNSSREGFFVENPQPTTSSKKKEYLN